MKMIFSLYVTVVLLHSSATAQIVLVKGNPLTKSDPSLIHQRYAPGDWQNTAYKVVVEGVIYNFYEQSGFAPLNNIIGSPFYNQEWKKATIRLKDGSDLPQQEVIYLVSYQLMFWKIKDGTGKVSYNILDPNSIKGILFEDDRQDATLELIPGWFDHEGKRFVAYFQLLSDGKAPLVKYHRRKIEYEYEYNNPAGKLSFIPSYDYYYQASDSSWVTVNPATFKSQVAASFPAHTTVIAQWFNRNSFNARKEKDLIAFFEWLRGVVQ